MADSGGDYLGLLGLLGAAALSSAGAIYTNHQQRKLQQSVNAMAVDLADSAHQQEVLDLYKAGLNPILSATGNGASVPSLGTPRLDNVLSDFGSSARGIGEMMSRQRSLGNEAVRLDNESMRLSNRVAQETVDSDIASARSEAYARQQQAEYDATIAADKLDALRGWRMRPFRDNRSPSGVVWKNNPDYEKQISDSMKAEVKRPGTRYLQSWIDTGGRAINNVTSSALDLKNVIRKPVKAAGWRSNLR